VSWFGKQKSTAPILPLPPQVAAVNVIEVPPPVLEVPELSPVPSSQSLEEVIAERDQLRRACGFVPPGHFYSPIAPLDEIRRDEERIFGTVPTTIPGVNLNEAAQLELLKRFVPFYDEMPFQSEKIEGFRYQFENHSYSYSDGTFLYCMIRHLMPKRIIEVGSGFSSCVTLDTNEHFAGGAIKTTFVEPYPELLRSLLKPSDEGSVRILPTRLQEVPIDEFKALQADDILFIDSTHVSRIDSDVNRVFFDILPVLNPGVHVHFHDIFFPFEYPKEWIFEGRAWNETYMLRAFLQYNSTFEIVMMNTFMEHVHEEFFREHMPLCLKNRGGSIWLRKTA